MISIKEYSTHVLITKQQGNWLFSTHADKGKDAENMAKALENYNIKEPYSKLFQQLDKVKNT